MTELQNRGGLDNAALNNIRPQVPPVEHGANRPCWSVMIPTYNCAAYMARTLESILQQDPGPEQMHIEVVDDCSTADDPESVVWQVGRGRVEFFRQPANSGAIANFNTCANRSKGELVHLLHGDDLVADGFYQRLQAPLLAQPHLGAACCRQIYIDDQGRSLLTTRAEQPQTGLWTNALKVLAVSNRIPPPGMVIKRHVYEMLGGYDPRLFHAADWEMWVRVASRYPIWYELEPLAFYRVHAISDTSKLIRTGQNMQNRREAIRIFREYLPPDQAKQLARKSLTYATLYGLRMAVRSFLKTKSIAIFAIQLRETTICAWKALLT